VNVCFYSPFVVADPKVPSGAARVATLFQRALSGAGMNVHCPALPRTFDGKGDAVRQREAKEASAIAAEDLLEQIARGNAPRPALWFSYHVYYKSPDWIGPAVARRLGIPYVLAEGSHAPKRQNGPWHAGHAATTDALRSAQLLLAMTAFDRFCLEQLCPGRVRDLKPFIDCTGLRAGTPTASPALRLIAAGMMRNERKRDSYFLLADALALLAKDSFSLEIAGDGRFRSEIEQRFSAASKRGHVRFLGALEHQELLALMSRSDVFAWPGIGEAYGITYLEAQACGLPVVACSNRGVTDVTRDGVTALLCPPDEPDALAAAIMKLATDQTLRRQMSAAAHGFVHTERSLEHTSRLLRDTFAEVLP
jgi:glycosyltransferase involved in cell wall biosynthesis